jgi:hypothetical protein
MKLNVLILGFLLTQQGLLIGQYQKYHPVEIFETELINDVCYSIKDSSSSFIISPFIISTIDYSFNDLKSIVKQYGFNKHLLNKKLYDTLLITSNKYFKILEPDSLIKYNNAQRDTSSLITDPLIEYIKNKTGKNGICFFEKSIFSNTKEYAIIEYRIYCGFLCGKGEMLLMRKTKGGWLKIKTLVTSIS